MSRILSTGGVSASVHAGMPPPTPHPGKHAGRYGQRAGGTHPTGMQSCGRYFDVPAQICNFDGFLSINFDRDLVIVIILPGVQYFRHS